MISRPAEWTSPLKSGLGLDKAAATLRSDGERRIVEKPDELRRGGLFARLRERTEVGAPVRPTLSP
ncbi:hypothetical protein C1D09_009430 [Mesorhizobium intechi]|uniref:hypothetical protein n=1 Tax=Mesorhizobium intechi TaxID=537601 RepID=UPI000CC467D8|nr:hypothetical protein [Mesorhizobium intechi]TSE12295.1 hypothetical protein C1D09_009430 [Mesorhizobium intechi]